METKLLEKKIHFTESTLTGTAVYDQKRTATLKIDFTMPENAVMVFHFDDYCARPNNLSWYEVKKDGTSTWSALELEGSLGTQVTDLKNSGQLAEFRFEIGIDLDWNFEFELWEDYRVAGGLVVADNALYKRNKDTTAKEQ